MEKTVEKSKSHKEFEKLLSEDLGNRRFKEGEITTGTIEEIGKKFVFTTNDIKGELVEELFRVKGIFKTGSKEIDGHFVQSDIEIARKIAGLGSDDVSQLGIIVKNPDTHESLIKDLQKSLAKNNGVFLS